MGGFVVAESQKTLCPHKLPALNWWSSWGTFQAVYDIAWPALKRAFSWQCCLGTWPNPGQVMWGSQLLLRLLALSCGICCIQLPCEMLCSLPCASVGVGVSGAEGIPPCLWRGQRKQGCLWSTKVWVNAVERQCCVYALVLAVSPQSLGLCLQSCCSCDPEMGLAVVALGHRDMGTMPLLSFAVTSLRRIGTWPKPGKERQTSFSELMNMTSPWGRPLEVRIKWLAWFHANLIKNNLIIQLAI